MKLNIREQTLRKLYEELGSSHRVAALKNVSNGTVISRMKKYHIPRIPKLHLYNNNSGKGRRCELYLLGHPFFIRHMMDLGIIDDKSKFDVLWHGDRVNIKSSHSKRFMFSIKNKRHNVSYYICCCYDDDIDPLIPIEIFIIPSKIAPHSGITISNIKKDGKYYPYRFSIKRDKDFSVEEEQEYNKFFRKTFLCLINKGKGGDKK